MATDVVGFSPLLHFRPEPDPIHADQPTGRFEKRPWPDCSSQGLFDLWSQQVDHSLGKSLFAKHDIQVAGRRDLF
jgi:hypothetical protein